MKKACILAIGGALLSSAAQAASPATTSFNVTITIEKECTVTKPADINLGTHGSTQPLATTISGNTTFSVTCSKGTGYTIGFVGANDLPGTPPTHQMKGAASGNTDFVQYSLVDFTSGTAGAPLGGTNVITDTGNGTAQSKTLKATVTNYTTAVQNDTYTDTVTMSVAY